MKKKYNQKIQPAISLINQVMKTSIQIFLNPYKYNNTHQLNPVKIVKTKISSLIDSGSS